MAASAMSPAPVAASRSEDLRQLQQRADHARIQEDLRRLQQQMDQVRVQLALLGPVQQQVRTTQEYFERTEMEASSQLQRLRRARIGGAAGDDARGSDEGEPQGPQQEIARWLHMATDVVLALCAQAAAESAGAPEVVAQPQAVPERRNNAGRHPMAAMASAVDVAILDTLKEASSAAATPERLVPPSPATPSTGAAVGGPGVLSAPGPTPSLPMPRRTSDSGGASLTQGVASARAATTGQPPTPEATYEALSPLGAAKGGGSSRSSGGLGTSGFGDLSHRADQALPPLADPAGWKSANPTERNRMRQQLLEQAAQAIQGLPRRVQSQDQPPGAAPAPRPAWEFTSGPGPGSTGPSASALGMLIGGGDAVGAGLVSQAQPKAAAPHSIEVAWSRGPADNGARGLPPDDGALGSSRPPDSAELSDGITLGQGSWAAAYRRAAGPRLESLRLLRSTGIVTARELEDDLTVVDEEHIDECALISSEMLDLRPLSEWRDQPEEARRIFEEKFTQLYQNRFKEAG